MTSLIAISVRCFAAARECLQQEQMSLQVPSGITVDGVRRLLVDRAPLLANVPLAFAVNCAYATAEQVLQSGDELALIPPISGGSLRADLYRFTLTHAAIDPRLIESEARSDADGALVTFAGTTRDHNDGAQVLKLSYEAYPEMAQKVMGAIFEEAVKRFTISRARVVHRLGEVPVGEASVLVVVAAAHRDAAFDACRFLMDRLKNEVPIFKRETLAKGKGDRWLGELPKSGN
ncbi:MAG: molybdenum cofactor biosynthesis protein MoaE [Planctomycetota bacterium]|jgi:molybdopterin synthase catalytic subunit|nr:molybdenum cofactor biosynthesis protein MoaE [Planctomycetota bacterium]